MITSFEEELRRSGRVIYRTCGDSMLPLIREGRDIPVIELQTPPFRRYDIVLFRRGEHYVLHRVLKVFRTKTGNTYFIAGDNRAYGENVPEQCILGRMTALWREDQLLNLPPVPFGCRFWRLRFVLLRCRNLLRKQYKKHSSPPFSQI